MYETTKMLFAGNCRTEQGNEYKKIATYTRFGFLTLSFAVWEQVNVMND